MGSLLRRCFDSPAASTRDFVADASLVDLADAGLGELADEFDEVWHLPRGDPRRQKPKNPLCVGLSLVTEGNQCHGSFSPPLVGHGNHSRLRHRRVGGQMALQLDELIRDDY